MGKSIYVENKKWTRYLEKNIGDINTLSRKYRKLSDYIKKNYLKAKLSQENHWEINFDSRKPLLN